MQSKLTQANGAAFLELLAEERTIAHPEADSCGWVVGLEDALETVWCRSALHFYRRPEGREPIGPLNRRRYHTAAAELLEATKGQPFRADTAAGPLFIQGCLWRFAGQSDGSFEGNAESKWRPSTPPPAWGSEWRLPVLAAVREVA